MRPAESWVRSISTATNPPPSLTETRRSSNRLHALSGLTSRGSPLHSHSEVRIAALCEAQGKAELLFRQVEERGLIRAGITEHELNEAIFALAEEIYGIRTYWHKRIVRAGKNTLLPYAENPPDLTIGEDDIFSW